MLGRLNIGLATRSAYAKTAPQALFHRTILKQPYRPDNCMPLGRRPRAYFRWSYLPPDQLQNEMLLLLAGQRLRRVEDHFSRDQAFSISGAVGESPT